MSRKERIEQLLNEKLTPSFLLVENESTNHHVPKGSETHFKITLVSEHFKPLKRLERHRQINHLMQSEFDTGLHALSLHLHTEEEWATQPERPSPVCKGGHQH